MANPSPAVPPDEASLSSPPKTAVKASAPGPTSFDYIFGLCGPPAPAAETWARPQDETHEDHLRLMPVAVQEREEMNR